MESLSSTAQEHVMLHGLHLSAFAIGPYSHLFVIAPG